MNYFFAIVWAVLEKDIRVEIRTRESLLVMLVFALLVLTIFSFAFGPGQGGKEAAPTQAGILWVAFLFSSVIGFSRSMGIEREGNGFSAMRLSPADPSALFFGKMLAIFFLVAIMEIVGFAALAVFYRAQVWENIGMLSLVAFIATAGISAVGTLFAAMTARTRARDALLPVLLFPLLVPVLIAAVKATAAILGGAGWDEAGDWVKLLMAFDLIFIAVSAVTFEFMLEE
ncbi:MAG: ABC transporter permease [Nitrospinaceae bacterium]|nr:ABC transporter permease [Nitrospinaceae bacterium]MBT3434226.1 ABC transporter permease [Nitrospinaceae bacterium]MBT3820641.1 ABC transporter permease [Nitrospinaceae bacterium]MBT4095522.1 ABC transporter permease [Nitrospinaceae bacterium]MBT4430249.1 ABC transporter permease [Nitrospinaceae bacterium]